MDTHLNYFPDGLTEAAIDALLAELDATTTAARRPTTPFADQVADERRLRRMRRRVTSHAIRTLPVQPDSSVAELGEAA